MNNYLNVTLDNVHWISGQIFDRSCENKNEMNTNCQDDNQIIRREQLDDKNIKNNKGEYHLTISFLYNFRINLLYTPLIQIQPQRQNQILQLKRKVLAAYFQMSAIMKISRGCWMIWRN